MYCGFPWLSLMKRADHQGTWRISWSLHRFLLENGLSSSDDLLNFNEGIVDSAELSVGSFAHSEYWWVNKFYNKYKLYINYVYTIASFHFSIFPSFFYLQLACITEVYVSTVAQKNKYLMRVVIFFAVGTLSGKSTYMNRYFPQYE